MQEFQISKNNKDHWPNGWREGPKIMGVINITPDSFSDGGLYINPLKALDRAFKCLEEGADVLDIGGQSTRPGAEVISYEEELLRVVPVLKLLRKELPNTLLSIDTFYSKVAQKALDLGVNWVNDISGGRQDAEILKVVADSESPFVITCLLYTSPSPRDVEESRMPSSA